MLTLHHWPLDPASRQARVALAEKGLGFELTIVEPWNDPDALAALSEARLPPVLVEESDRRQTVFADLPAILGHLEDQRREPALLPLDVAGRAEARRIAHWFDRKFDGEVNAYLLHEKLEKRVQGLGAPDMEAIRIGRDFLKQHLAYFDRLLSEREGLAGARYTLADIAGAAHLSCLDYLGDIAWDQHPHVKTWYERIKCRPAFRPLLEDRLPGTPPVTWYAELDF